MAQTIYDKLDSTQAELLTEDYTSRFYKIEPRFSLTATFGLVSPENHRLTEPVIRNGSIEQLPVTFKATEAVAADGTTMTIDGMDGLRNNQLIRNYRSDEVAKIVKKPGTDGALTLTLQRGTVATTGTAAAAVVSGDLWIAGATPMDEGFESLPAAIMQMPVGDINYIEQWAEPITWTGRAGRLVKNGSPHFGLRKKDLVAAAKRLLRRQMAVACVWGQKANPTGDSGFPNTKTSGIIASCGWFNDGSATYDMTSETVFENLIDRPTTYCKSGRLLMGCSWTAWQSIHRLYQLGSQSNQNDILTIIGTRLKTIASINNVDIVPYRDQLIKDYTDDAGNKRGSFLLWDPNEVSYVPLAQTGVYDFHTNHGDNTTMYWMAEGGFRIKNAKAHMFCRGVLPVA